MKKILFAALALLLVHSPIGAANSSVSISKSLTAVDSALTVTARGFNSVSYQLSGTWVGTVKFEGTVNSTTWKTVYAVNQTGGAVDSVATANGVYLLSGNGFLWIRARVSAYTSGTIAIQAITNEGSGVVSLLNQSSAGASSNVAVTSSTLPTGAATAANQTNGAHKTQIVDASNNVAGMTANALDVNIKSGASSGAVAQGSTTSGQTGGLTQAAVTTAAPSYTTGQTSPLSLDVSGGLRVSSHPVTQSGTWTVQPGNTANTTAWLTTGTGGTFPATQSGTWNITNVSGTVSLPTGAATAAKQPALGTAGSPSTDVISVQGVASGTAMPVSAASLPLPSLASTSTKQSDGSQKTQIVDGSGNVIASTSNNLNVQCANCSGSGASAADEASFTAGSSTFAPAGVFYQTTATSNPLTTGQQGMLQATAQRAAFVNLRNASGTEVGTASTPVQVSLANTASNGTAVSVTCGNCSGSGVSAADEATFTAGSTSQALIGGFYQTTATSNALTTGQQGAFQVTANRALFVNPRNSSGTEIATASNPYRTDPTGTTTQPVSYATTGSGTATGALRVELPTNGTGVLATVGAVTAITNALPAGSNVIGALTANQSVNVAQINGVTPLMGNGVTGTGSPRVTIASDNTAFSVNAIQSGTWTVQPGNTANTTAWKVDNSAVNQPVVGAAAQGASVTGNPVMQGMEGRSTDITAVTSGQVVRPISTVDGKQIFMPYAIQGSRWSYAAASGGIVNTTGVTIKTAAGAGIRNCVTSVDIENGHATVSTEVVLRDGASGTVIKRWWTQAAGGGIAKTLPVPLCGTANTLLEVAAITTGSAVYVNAEGYSAAE